MPQNGFIYHFCKSKIKPEGMGHACGVYFIMNTCISKAGTFLLRVDTNKRRQANPFSNSDHLPQLTHNLINKLFFNFVPSP